MSRRAAVITQADVARVIRAAQQCGAGAVEIKPDGTIRVIVSPSVQPTDDEVQTSIENEKPLVF